jgi:hypothetical protein
VNLDKVESNDFEQREYHACLPITLFQPSTLQEEEQTAMNLTINN